jgi:hypothetical protein
VGWLAMVMEARQIVEHFLRSVGSLEKLKDLLCFAGVVFIRRR